MKRMIHWLAGVGTIFALVAGAAAYAASPRPPINCKFVLCALPDCLENEHLTIPPGACCPVCVPN